MTISIWRYSHLGLAIISSLFLVILSVTGVILSIDAIRDKKPAYQSSEIENLNLAQTLTVLRKVYSEIIEISVDHHNLVRVSALDQEGNSVTGYVNPSTGALLGSLQDKSPFIQWTIALHRSLFLHETGRIIIGTVTFLLFLIALSGSVLIVKRQQGFRYFFDKISRDFFSQYYHVVSGQWLLIPIMIISLSGTYLFLVQMGLIRTESETYEWMRDESEPKDWDEFDVFQETDLIKIEKIEFPFILDDPEEYFILHLRDRTLHIDQTTGEIVIETRYPYSLVLEKLSMDLHTGRTSVIWALILGLASLNILTFIYTGFRITFRRLGTKSNIKNPYTPQNAEIVLMVGSENGSTWNFANQIHRQLLDTSKRSLLIEMNQFTKFPKADHLIILTSTFGQGAAPSNALNFMKLALENTQNRKINFSVIGFGSTSYVEFCGFAKMIDEFLTKQSWAAKLLPFHTVNDKSASEFVHWIQMWNEQTNMSLTTVTDSYRDKKPRLVKLKVISKTQVSETNSTFKIVFKVPSGVKFQSGDLLTIFPAKDHQERFYSIAQRQGSIQLIVKLFEGGLGSGFLYNLEIDSKIDARLVQNTDFHLPTEAYSVTMIANGTGIAPFLGMVYENENKVLMRLYSGFRYENELIRDYEIFMDEQMEKKRLESYRFVFSREHTRGYVMDLIENDRQYFVEQLENNGTIMICGARKMQEDVEQVLNHILSDANGKSLQFYKENKQVLTDCY